MDILKTRDAMNYRWPPHKRKICPQTKVTNPKRVPNENLVLIFRAIFSLFPVNWKHKTEWVQLKRHRLSSGAHDSNLNQNQRQRILLCRLNIGEQSEGSWTLPGGGIDFGEIPQEAAIREVYEETGLNVEIDRIVDAHSELFVHPEREMHAVRMVFLANVTSGEIRFEENGSTDRCQFVTLEEAESMQCVGLVRRCIRLIRCTDLLSLNP